MSIRHISSKDNPQYKQLRQLAGSAQARRKQAKTLLDGVHLCQAWLQHRGKPLLCVVGESALLNTEVSDIVSQCESLGTDALVVPDAHFAALSQVDNGVGLLFLIDTPENHAPVTLEKPALLLDGLQDPGNLGSILRSAAAAGIAQVICGVGTTFAWSPKVLRAGMGAHFVLEIFEHADLHSLIAASKLPVYATSSHARETIYQMDLSAPCAWLFGQEGRGVAEHLLAAVSHQLSIPQEPGIESLNVAAAVAVCLFEQRRQIISHP